MKRLLVPVLLLVVACNRESATPAAAPAQTGNAERGRELVARYGCNVCHAIPGIDGPQGSLGPSLAGIASRPTLRMAAVPNTPANLTRFILNPATLNPQSSMPAMAVPPDEAEDMTAYLMTLR